MKLFNFIFLKIVLIFGFIVLNYRTVSGQDSLAVNSDSLKRKNAIIDTLKGKILKATIKETRITLGKTFGVVPILEKDIPKVAFVRSLLLPGWGQITNKQ